MTVARLLNSKTHERGSELSRFGDDVASPDLKMGEKQRARFYCCVRARLPLRRNDVSSSYGSGHLQSSSLLRCERTVSPTQYAQKAELTVN